MLKYKSQTEKPHEDIRNTVNAQEVKDIQNTSKSNAHGLQLNTDIYTSIMKKKPKRYTARTNEADPLTTKERDENIKNDVLNKLIKHFDRNSVKNTIETEQNTEENLNADNKKTDPNVDNISRKDKLATEKNIREYCKLKYGDRNEQTSKTAEKIEENSVNGENFTKTNKILRLLRGVYENTNTHQTARKTNRSTKANEIINIKSEKPIEYIQSESKLYEKIIEHTNSVMITNKTLKPIQENYEHTKIHTRNTTKVRSNDNNMKISIQERSNTNGILSLNLANYLQKRVDGTFKNITLDTKKHYINRKSKKRWSHRKKKKQRRLENDTNNEDNHANKVNLTQL